nr:uncharacterized protein LOC109154045 [Ipomoea batatas]
MKNGKLLSNRHEIRNKLTDEGLSESGVFGMIRILFSPSGIISIAPQISRGLFTDDISLSELGLGGNSARVVLGPATSNAVSVDDLADSILSNSGFILRLKHGGSLGKLENPNYVGGLTAMYNNIEIDEWGLITLLDKMKELGYACVDIVQFFMKTVRGLVELVTDKVAWDTFNELDLFDVVEVWAVGGEMNESFGEDSSYDGEIDDSDCGSLDALDYEINIDPNVEYCGEDHHVISKDGQHLNRVHVKLHCTVCKKEGHNRRKCPLNPTVSNRQNNPRRKSTTKKQGPTCSSASQVDPSSTQEPPVDPTSSQAPPVEQTSSQAPPVDQTSSEAPPVDQTSSPSDAQPAGMEDDITDQMLADLDIDAFVSNLIDGSGIGSGQQQQAPQVQWRFSMYTLGGRGSSGANDGSAMTLDHEH